MTLYKLIQQVSDILTPDTNDFYTYLVYTSDDDGGFLRTRYCWRLDKPLKDKIIHNDYSKILVASTKKINLKDLKKTDDTLVKLQFHYDITNVSVEDGDADWDIEMGYNRLYIFDLINKSYIMKHIKMSTYMEKMIKKYGNKESLRKKV